MKLMQFRQASNIPETWWQARDAGMTAEEYISVIDEAGLGTEMILDDSMWP